MAQTVKLKRSAVPGKVPTTSDLDLGELALNTHDGKLFLKRDNGTPSIVELGAGGGANVHYGTTPPADTTALWVNTEDLSLNVYYEDVDSGQWVTLSGPAGPAGADSTVPGPQGPAGNPGITVSSTPPADPVLNQLWLDIS